MKTQDIKNELVKQVVKAALQNKFKVTIANIRGENFVKAYGTPFRIKKGNMFGWDILFALAKHMKTTGPELLKGNTGENNTPGFFIFDKSIIVTDPETKTDESTLNENNVPECWKIFIVFRDGDNDYARTYSKNIQVFHSKEEAERKAKEIKAQTPEVKTVSVCKFNGWEGKYEFADKN